MLFSVKCQSAFSGILQMPQSLTKCSADSNEHKRMLMRSSGMFPINWSEGMVLEYRYGCIFAILFDFDGTLTPNVGHPKFARLPPHTLSLLSRLKSLPEICLGVISGRARDDVRTLIGLEGICYLGSGGLEIDLRGNISRDPLANACDERLDLNHQQLLGLTNSYTGTSFERKPGGLAVHFRALTLLAAEPVRRGAVSVFTGHGTLRQRVWRKQSKSLRPRVEVRGRPSKKIGTTRRTTSMPIPSRPFLVTPRTTGRSWRRPLGAGGVAIEVGPNAPTVARVRLVDTDELATRRAELVANREEAVAIRMHPNSNICHG